MKILSPFDRLVFIPAVLASAFLFSPSRSPLVPEAAAQSPSRDIRQKPPPPSPKITGTSPPSPQPGPAPPPAISPSREATTRRPPAAGEHPADDPFTAEGDALADLDQYDKAVINYERALSYHRERGTKAGVAASLNNLARAFYALGRYEKVIEHAGEALLLTRELGRRLMMGAVASAARDLTRRSIEADAHNLLGLADYALGRYEKSVASYERALSVVRGLRDLRGEAGVLNNIGESYRLLGRHAEALTHLEQALKILRAAPDRKREGLVLDSLGAAYYEMGKDQEAVAYLSQALAAHREVGNRFDEGITLSNLGRAYRRLGRHDESVESLEKALVISREVKSLREEGVALSGLMAAWKSRGVPALAVFYGKQAVNAFQEIRANIRGLGRDSQKSFLRSNEETYRALTDLLVSQGRLPEAEQVLGMLKEEEFFQFVRRDGSGLAPSAARATLGPGEAALEAEYRALADRVTLAGRLRGDLLARRERTDEEERQLDGLEAQLATATDHFQKFLEQLEVKLRAGGAAGGRVGEVRDALGMQKTLRELGDGAVLLYTLVGEDGYRVMLFTPDTQQAYENPVTARDLAQRVLAFRAALQDPRSDPAPQARDLYDILVGPKLSHDLRQAGARTLMWSLDGVLRYLPVAALRDAEQKYLVETYRNVIFTPASRDRLKDPVAARWQGLGLGVSKGKEVLLSDVNRRMAFKALPGVPRELRSIINDKAAGQATASSGGLLEGKVLLDESFTKDALRLELRRQYPLVHIASHFMFRPGNETDSFLLLGGEGEQNERLTVAELKRVSFEGVDLLTLSACETAMSGEGANGVEVESFGVLAQRQGAEAVLATLWPVADASTPLLMREFYRLREASPEVTKAEALRLAQLALLKEKVAPSGAAEEVRGLDGMMRATANFSHPFYWAPFILIGNWK